MKNCHIGGYGLAALQNKPSLQVLSLTQTRLTNDDLADLKPLKNLVYLNIGFNDITDEGIAYLRHMTQLEGLHIRPQSA